MQRIELYTPVHKGLRAEAFELARELSRTDWSDDAQAAAAAGRVARLVEFLDEHAQHEDTHLMPLVARAAPALARELEAEHARVDAALRGLAALAARVREARNGGRTALGRELERCFQLALAEQLVHLQREEHEAEPALHAHLDQAELVRAHELILADQRAAQFEQDWLQIADWPELDDGFAFHAPVGSYRANAFGLYDVLGNVCEWCDDVFGDYATPPAPGDGRRTSGYVLNRPLRGGGFSNDANELRCAKRVVLSPEVAAPQIGLRPIAKIAR